MQRLLACRQLTDVEREGPGVDVGAASRYAPPGNEPIRGADLQHGHGTERLDWLLTQLMNRLLLFPAHLPMVARKSRSTISQE